MARLSRLILKDLARTHPSPLKTHPWTFQLLHQFSAATSDHHDKPDTKDISISDSTKKSKFFSPRRRRRRSLWSGNNDRSFPSPLSGFGNAIVEAATNMNKLLESLTPSRLIRGLKEKEESYNVKYEMPGLSKEDVKITVEDGMLFIRGERKEELEDGGSDDDEHWSMASFGYYNTSLMLPEDAKVEEIKAEMKDGVLHVMIPKDETKKKQIKEIHVG